MGADSEGMPGNSFRRIGGGKRSSLFVVMDSLTQRNYLTLANSRISLYYFKCARHELYS
jgi:hypothetical protein